MLSGLFFAFWRWMEIITLIPTLGMLSWFVNGFVKNNQLTPNYVLVLFITSVLGAVWAIATLLAYHRTKHSAIFVSFVDFLFVGAFIGSVVALRDIANADCARFGSDGRGQNIYISLGSFGSFSGSFGSVFSVNFRKSCAMLKACFALGIMNCVFFAITSVLALFIHRKHREVVVKETHVRRHGHRRSGSGGSRNSRSSQRRRQYYV
ncbi:MAG: hypothetical protein M1832_004196 [Thelocarpon impressellum]|nr:MAG: hypothetical protein M1832_004196 [Thelocarpon impressellum]